MLSILYTFFPMLFLFYWTNSILSMFVLLMISVVYLNHYFSFSMDMIFSLSSLNMLMVFLSIIVCLLSFLSTPENKKSKYLFCIGVLSLILTLAFSVENYMMFYIFFEASLIPTLFLVVFWGYQPERLQAGYYMMIYTVSASLPLLLVLLYLFNKESTMMFYFVNVNYMYLTVIIFIAFLVKMPMYMLHFWLPKAHVEASLAGSMILAGILLKLGGFGLIQMSKIFSLSGDKNVFLIFLLSVSIWGALLASIQCMRQNDMKSFVAYSSVAHMALVIVGILVDQNWGIVSAIITMFAHAFSSSALFCLTYFTYKKVNSRNMNYMKGMLTVFPILALAWFVLCSVNMAAPPTLNLIGEMFIISSMSSMSMMFMFIMALLIFFSALYNMYLYTNINHGKLSNYINPSYSMQTYQYVSVVFHILPLLFLFKMEIFI
uniref:NADH dehydrogenase subunit 4 n=1 Tax=Ferrissia californica TaxID=1776375 RepID=UPI00315CD25D